MNARARVLAAVTCLSVAAVVGPGHVTAATPCGSLPTMAPASVVPWHWQCLPDDDRPGAYDWAAVVNIPS